MSAENVVFRKIKEMSHRVPNPRPQIPLSSLASELSLLREQILPAVKKLHSMRLIQHTSSPNAAESIKLTLLGFNVTR